MKKPIMMALSLALLSSMALAQPAAAPPPAGAKVAPPAQLKNDLDLTDEQVKKMREIRDQGGSRAEMQAVLTPEQRTKQAALRKAHKGERKERRAQMQKELGLSDAQMKKLDDIRKNDGSREEMRAVLTPEQQAKFDTLRSQHPGHGPKPGSAPAAKPAASSAPPPPKPAP